MSIPNNPLPVDPNKKMNPLLGQASGEGSPVSGPPIEEPDYILGGPLEENLPEGDPNDPFQEDVSAQYNEEQDFDPYEIGGVIPGEWGNPDEEAPLTGELEPKPLTEDEWSPDTGGGSITGQLEGITATPLQGKAAEVRTARYQFALGDPYTREELYNAIRTGTEDSIRKKVAALADIKDRQAKLDVIKEKAASGKPITPEDVALMANISNFQPFNDPKTIIERQYATRYFDTMFGLNTDSRSVMQQAYRTNPEKLSERKTHYETLVAKQEIIKGIIESVDSMYQQQSWIGWGVDQAKLMFPLYSSAKLRASTSGAESLKEGEIIQDLVFKYRTLPLSQMADTMRKEIMNIAKDNPSLAKKLAEAVLFYTKSDASFDNFVSVADALTFPGLGTAFRGARRGAQAVRDLRAGKAAGEAVDPVETAFQAGVKANADPQVNPAKVLNEVGDVERSAQVTNTNMLRGELAAKNGATPPKDQVFEEIQRRLPSFSNSTKIVEGGPTNLARGRIEIFAQNLQRITDEFTERLRSETKIQRLPEETLELAIRANTEKLVADRANHLQNLVLDVGHVRPEDTRANVGSVSVSFGNREMKPFETADDARKVAQNDYGFAPGTFKVEQAGIGGYKITLTAPIDETLPVVRQNLNLGGNRAEPSTARTFFGRILSADNRVPEFQRANRLSVVHNKSFMDGIVKEFTKEVGRLSKKQADEVQSVMHADKFEVNQPLSVKAGKEILGVYRETVEEFEKAFHSIHGKFPTEAQVKSYFTWRRLNDMDYMIRNLNTYREMSRMGWQEVVVLDRTVDDAGKVANSKDRFHGKIVDELPIYHKDDTGVVIHTSGQTPKSFRLRDIKNNPELMQEIKTLQEQGYKIVHNVNPVRTVMDGKLSKGDTGFIITKDVEVHPLREVQIKYRPGWHNEYAQTDYVKVPIIDENGRYLGDQAIFGFHASGPAKKYAAAMEEARKALLRGDDAAIDRVKNLPMTSKDFKKLFQERIDPTTGEVIPAKLNIKAPFLHINEGRTLGDVYQNTLRESLGTFENLVDNAFNEMKHIDKKFMGQRNGPLETVIERMDPNGQPLLSIGMADQVDPIQSMRNTIANVTRSRYFDDYRNAHVEGWVQQFGHLLNVPKEELLGNPAAHFYEPKFGKHANFEEVRLAEDSRRAALELLGTPDAISQAIDHTRAKMLEQVYEKKGMEALNEKARKYIRKEDQETAGLLRAVAFHPTMGMFNPYQLFQNAMTTVNAIAIAGPVNGMKGVATTLPMRWVYSNERLLDTMANQSRAYGWKPEWFKEAYGELKKTGRLVIEGENAYMSNMSNPNPISTRWGDFLEAGTVFFREGERFNRIAAHSMAYLEWRTANPTAKITNSVSLQIMKRADDMTANMTRASNAGYQYGLTSIPAQFTSYFTRLSEQMLGKKITPAEKARVIALNSLVFGVPVGLLGASGLGALTFGQFPGGEAFRKWMYNQRVDMNDEAVDAFMNGVLGMAARAVSGVPTDLSAKVGPGGGSLIKDLFFEDKSFVEAIFGASGSTVGSLWRALDPGIKWSMSMFKGGENTYQFRPEDVVNILRIVKSADHVHNIYWAAQTQKYFAKTGQNETGTNQPFTVTQAVVRALTGAMPATMTDRILLQTMSIDRQKLLRETLTKVAPSLAAGMAAADKGDMELAEVYRQRVMFIFDLADFTPQERAQAWLEVAKQHRGRIDKVWMDFYTKNVPMSKRPKSMETFGKEIERQNQNNPQQEER